MPAVKKILVTGAGGLLGSEFKSFSHQKGSSSIEIIPKTHSELDISKPKEIERAFDQTRPDFLINCAAFTQVDEAERQPDQARMINVDGPLHLAQACKRTGVKLIHYGTDFVFDGKKGAPYLESDLPCPINEYGKSKWEGEKALQSILDKDQYLILRISWPYGKNGKNFIHTLWELSKTRPELRVVTDQVGVPNPARLLAQKTLQLLSEATGLLHLSCQGFCTRYELIRFLLENLRSSCTVTPVSSDEFPLPAKRPAFSALATENEVWKEVLKMPTWQEALLDYLKSVMR